MEKRLALVGAIVAVSVGAVLAVSDEVPQFPKPQAEHEWLTKLAGEWECEVEALMPGQTEPVRSKGTETVRSLGGFWIVAENRGEMMGQPFTGILTIGYDAPRKKYVGTWVDSMNGHLWTYEGTVDGAGRALTLETEGPCCLNPGTTAQFREVLEVKSEDHKVFRASMRVEDGEWIPLMSIDYRRKK